VSSPMLEINHINAFYGRIQALWDVCMSINEGEIVAIIGANGAGKTTLLHVISGILRPASGTITFLGQRIESLSSHAIVELGISHIPEGRKLFTDMSVQENLEMGAYSARAWKLRPETIEQVYRVFPILKERDKQLARTLSGGEQQMLAMGRGLMSRPKLCIIDEPSNGLAPRLVTEVFQIIKSLREQGITILLIEQNVHQTLEIADRACVLENGRIALEGGCDELIQSEHIKKAYLGLSVSSEEVVTMTKPWAEMTADEKQEALFQSWLSPKDPQGNDFKFQGPQAEQDYKARVTRLKDAIQMKKLPDRVPVLVLPSFFPVYNAGITPREAMYDYAKLTAAYKKFLLDFKPDGHIGADMPGPGRFFDSLDYRLYSWPGHGVPPERSYQANEGEYMKADEYDALIQDPSNFFSNVYFPRIFGALDSFKMLPTLTGILEMYGLAYNFIPFGMPPVQAAFKALTKAGNEVMKWLGAIGAWNQETTAAGYPNIIGGFTKAPFDTIGDTLRGTRGIMVDMYRQPDKLIEAMEALVPLMIKMGVGAARMNGKPLVFMPLHKGADGFLSDAQFRKFYWPTLKKVMMGLISEGVVPFPAAEGGYSTRLEVVQDLPKGKTCWMIDQTDMAEAKKTLGRVACLAGNVPSALLSLGTPQQVKDYAQKLIDTCAKDGGYIMSNGAFFDEARAENVHAMVDFAKEYGVYK
jgi:ABC-type branched-subunit amino acid transport system ATPase component/uroporphyrinogen-III decarboxylase